MSYLPVVDREMTSMRIVGTRKLPPVGLRPPTPDEIRAKREFARNAPRVVPKGVYFYRNHEEANAAMDRWQAEAMARRAREIADGAFRLRVEESPVPAAGWTAGTWVRAAFHRLRARIAG